tara:strand:+ start:448 stop:657 length:210 start_codon:yes stop_codon:yes gene_type:complete
MLSTIAKERKNTRDNNIAKERLGVARKALKKVVNYDPSKDWYSNVDYSESFYSLRLIAQRALEDMENIK